MEKALLLSPAYSWFVGLLVVMIVITLLFAAILYIALRPVNREGSGGDASYFKKLVERRQAELTAELLKNKSDPQKMDQLMAKLREVSMAGKVVDELFLEYVGPQEESKPAQRKPLLKGAQKTAKPQAAQQKPAQPQKSQQAQQAKPAPAQQPKQTSNDKK